MLQKKGGFVNNVVATATAKALIEQSKANISNVLI